jgi:hypothetical protein
MLGNKNAKSEKGRRRDFKKAIVRISSFLSTVVKIG